MLYGCGGLDLEMGWQTAVHSNPPILQQVQDERIGMDGYPGRQPLVGTRPPQSVHPEPAAHPALNRPSNPPIPNRPPIPP